MEAGAQTTGHDATELSRRGWWKRRGGRHRWKLVVNNVSTIGGGGYPTRPLCGKAQDARETLQHGLRQGEHAGGQNVCEFRSSAQTLIYSSHIRKATDETICFCLSQLSSAKSCPRNTMSPRLPRSSESSSSWPGVSVLSCNPRISVPIAGEISMTLVAPTKNWSSLAGSTRVDGSTWSQSSRSASL